MDRPTATIELEGFDGYWSEICACGHSVHRHVLTGTEYCRCETYPGECPCSGGLRVALVVREKSEKPTGVNTNSRFFRRPFHFDAEHPLNKAVQKCLESDAEIHWVIDECGLCGGDLLDGATAVWTDADGKPEPNGHSFTGKTLIVCSREGCATWSA